MRERHSTPRSPLLFSVEQYRGLCRGVLALLVTLTVWPFVAPTPSAAERPAPSEFDAHAAHSAFVVEPLTVSGAFEARHLEDRDHVSIIELSGGSYDKSLPDGSVNAEPRTVVAREFFATHQDEYDFLVVFTTFEFETGSAVAFHLGTQNQVQGIGLPIFDNTSFFGSDGKLQGYIDMAALTRYGTDPLAPNYDFAMGTLSHEMLHQWCCYVDYQDGPTRSRGLIGQQNAHWNYLLDTDASVMYGSDWRPNGDGTFTANAVRSFFSPLDLYLAGLYGADEVPPMTLLVNPAVDGAQLPQQGARVTATARTVELDDVVAAMGPRVPSAAEAQKTFRLAFILLTRPGLGVNDAQVAALNHLRDGFYQRFPALTGGRGIAQVYPEARIENGPGTVDPVTGGPLRPGQANLTEALTWLRERQTAQGFWQDTPATRLRDTAVVLPILDNLDATFVGQGAALGFLDAEPKPTADDRARTAVAFQALATDAAALRAELLNSQNADGGWGLGAGYGSVPLDTALAVQALAGRPTNEVPAARVAAAVAFLRTSQGADGGWGATLRGVSRTGVTAEVLAALKAAGETAPVSAALDFLAARQNVDGGFGDSPSTAHDTSRALQALMLFQSLERVDSARAASYLLGRQSVEGSWEGSVYTTALTVAALRRFSFPNWSFDGTPTAAPERPADGERVALGVRVQNSGNAFAPAGLVRFYDGDPAAGGTPIGSDVVLPPLAPGQIATVTTLWDTRDRAGLRTIFIVVDPADALPELSELDNRRSFQVEVVAPPAAADLEVRPADLSITPAAPNLLPTDLAVSIAVRNLGLTEVAAARVVLRRLDGATNPVVAEATVAVPARSSVAANFSYLLTTAGNATFAVEVDPDGAVAEASESNNVAQITVSTQPSLDLAVADAELSLEGGPALVGRDVTFRVTLRNRGTLDSPDVRVRYRVTDGTTTRELGENLIQPRAGQTLVQNVVWRVDLTGSLTFTVELDRQQVVPELDEANNNASLAFSAAQATAPNLTVSFRDLVFNPTPGLEGSPETISILLRNTGAMAVTNATLAFYDGDPGQGGVSIDRQVVPQLDAGASITLSYTYPEVPDARDRLIFVVADPDEVLVEADETDNRAFESLAVLSLPDLTSSSAGLELEPRFPRPGQEVSLTVNLANLGEQAAQNLAVRVYDGEPTAGGTPVAPDQVLPTVAGLGPGRVTFTWTFAGSGAARPLVAVLDPDGTVREGNENNNRAALDVVVQDGDFFVTERYFSPDGDGLKDATTLFFRLDPPGTATVQVLDRRNRVVRSSSPYTGVSAGEFPWDGLDQRGRVVQDGAYRLQLVTPEGVVRGATTVTVDTNRSSLIEAVGTEFELFSNLTCEPRSPQRLVFGREEDEFIFNLQAGDPSFPPGFYKVTNTGGDLKPILSATWAPFASVEDYELAPDGLTLAYTLAGQFTPGGPFGYQLWVANSDGTGQRKIGDNLGYDLFGFSSNGKTLYMADAEARRLLAIDLTGFLPPRTVYSGFGLYGYTLLLSPDRTRVVHQGFDPETENPVLVMIDLENATAQELLELGYSYPQPTYSWSPDSTRLAVTRPDPARVELFDRSGDVVGSFPLPLDLPPYETDCFGGGGEGLVAGTEAISLEQYAAGIDTRVAVSPQAVGGYGGVCEAFADHLGTPQWASTSGEFALYFGLRTNSFFRFARILRVDLGQGLVEHVEWTRGQEGGDSYHIDTWNGSAWQERGVLHYGDRYRERQFDLTAFLPDAVGDYKVRLRQLGREAAHVDSVALLAGPLERLLPTSVVDSATGQSLTARLTQADNEVADLWSKSVVVEFAAPPAGRPKVAPIRLALIAREEDLSDRAVVPFSYPSSTTAYQVTLQGDGPLVLDGLQSAGDELGEPLFRTRSRPVTGHPPADVLAWVKSDATHLYGVLDFTVDNTQDGEKDWAAIEVETPTGWQEFRVTASDRSHGQVGFTRTAPVRHEHKYYEFKVPLGTLGAQVGDTVSVRFRAYGTAATCADDPEACQEGLLELDGTLHWVPNERTLYYASQGFGRPPEAIFLDDEGLRRPLFENWFSLYQEEFTATGRRLLFDTDDTQNDPLSACYQLGTDRIAFSSLANLTVDLRPRRSASNSGILLEGTAADRHFKNFRLEYSTLAAPNVYNPVAPPSATPVIDGRLTTWVPPGPGTYFVRLTVEDLAGNLKQRIKRVASADQPSITDLYRDPEYISPNGDGVQDAAIIHYRVLEPVHLEFEFYNASGDRVRTLARDHSVIGTVHEVPWDGRGENGLPVPDGEYRLVVQDYEFFIKVDSTPPEVTTTLFDAYQTVFSESVGYDVVVVAPKLAVEVIERNSLTAEVETGIGATPFAWEPVPFAFVKDLDDPNRLAGTKQLALEEVTNRRFRENAKDKAGNRATASTPLASEELILSAFGPHVLLPDNTYATLEGAAAPDNHVVRLNFGDVRFQVAETVIADLLQVFVQFKQQDQTAWNEVQLTRFFSVGQPVDEITPYEFGAIWDMVGIPLGEVTDVRLRAVDESAHEHFSNKIEVLTDGLYFGGVLSESEDFEGPYGEILDQMYRRALARGDISRFDIVLWGVEFVPEAFESVVLPIRSPDDPRYATPVPLEPVYQQEGGFLWRLDPYSPCLTYQGNIVATTVPAPLSRTLLSNGAGITLPCLEIFGGQLAPPYGACNEPPVADERARFKLRPIAYDGVELVLMTVFQRLEDGTEDVLYSVNRPVSSRSYEFELDTRDLPEGTVALFGRLSNGEGRSHERQIPLWVDRTEPERLIQIPRPNQRLCGTPRETRFGLRNVLDLEGLIDDVAFADQVDLRLPGRLNFQTVRHEESCYTAQPEKPYGRGFVAAPLLLFGDPDSATPTPAATCTSIHGRLATWGDDEGETEFSGEATARVQVWDRGGFHVCEEVDFFYDGEVEGPNLTGLPRLFSPNNDGVLDEFEGTVTLDETAEVTVEVLSGRGAFGPVVRTLFTEQTVFDAQEVLWDGKDDGGAVVPDGIYTLKATFEDGCGNQAERFYDVEVDNTPPDLAIVYPLRGDPLPMIVAVQGAVDDLNLASWNVDYGLGLVPETWARISAGVRPVRANAPFLGSWNINGLVGETVVRLQGRDRAGNSAEVTANVLITNPVFLLLYAEAVPELFSPNRDGRRELQSFRFGLDSACLVRVEVRTQAGALVRLLEDGTRTFAAGAYALNWDGNNQAGNPANDGVYVYYIQAVLAQNANVTQEESVTGILDRTPPTIDITSPNAGFVSGRGAVAGSIFDAHLSQYQIEITDSPQAPAWEELASGTLSRENANFAVLSGLAEGEYALRIQADDEGEIHSENRIDFTVDNTPPVVALLAPEPGAILGGVKDPHVVAGTIEEAHLETWRLEFGLGSDPTTWSLIAQGTTVPTGETLAEWNVVAIADGDYTLRLTAIDKAGQSGQARQAVIIDNTPPTVEITTPEADQYVTRAMQVLGTASDLHLVEYELEVAAAGTQGWQSLGKRNVAVADGLLLNWEALPPDGDYQLRLSAVDAASNRATTVIAVTVDQTPPPAPILLVASSPNGEDAELDWNAVSVPDLAGYFVYRDGTKITPEPVPNPEYLDRGLVEGPYVYKVTAVDLAGNESAPSNEATVTVDRTPPTARISRPGNGDIVSGLVDIVGTAYSAEDFKEYRLYIIDPSGGGQQLLRRSPVPIQSDVLGQWNTLPLPEGALFRIRLEAEDLNRNVAVSEVTVTVDNQPPAAPIHLVGVAVGRDGQLTWNANTEPDLDGYLLFRDGRIANAPGVVVGDLTPFVIRTTTYLDRNLADGTYTYEVYAIDQAGNLSDPSNSVQITIDTRPPHAVIVDPPDSTRFGDTLYILATAEDNDVDRVLFQYRAVGTLPWLDLGPADTGLPWEIYLDPLALGLAYGDYELRPVATDRGGQTDPAPESIEVTYTDVTRPDAPLDLTTHVDGGDVTLNWTASTATDVVGYHLYRRDGAGSESQVSTAPIVGTTYVDAGLPDDTYLYWVTAIDGADNLSDPSNEAIAIVYTPVLTRRLTPTLDTTVTLEGCGLVEASTGGTLTSPSGTTAIPVQPLDENRCFSLPDVPLALGRNAISLRLTDPAGNVSKAATGYLVSVERPSAPTGLAATASANRIDLTWNPNPESNIQGYRAFRDGAAIGTQESRVTGLTATASSALTPPARAVDGIASTYWAPASPYQGETITFQLPTNRVVTRLEVDWGVSFLVHGVYGFDLEAWDGESWVWLAQVGYAGTTTAFTLPRPYGTDRLRLTLGLPFFNFVTHPVRLAEFRVFEQALLPTPATSDPRTDGTFEYTVTVVDRLGFESLPSAPATAQIGDVEPPPPVVLTATVDASDVTLTWTASAAPDVSFYELFRDGQPLASHTNLADLTFIDADRPNGTYVYTVRPVDRVGNLGLFSNEAPAVVAVAPPEAPIALTVTAPPTGGRLDAEWQAAPTGPAAVGFRLHRSFTSGGPYTAIGDLDGLFYPDEDVVNGTTYYYVVTALDALGNESATSNEAFGTPLDSQAPPAVFLHYPGYPGRVFETSERRTPIAGTAEPGSEVELYLEGVGLDTTSAAAQPSILTTNFSGRTTLAPNGRYLWLESSIGYFSYDTGNFQPVAEAFGNSAWAADSKSLMLVNGSRVARVLIPSGTVEEVVTVDFAEVAVPSPDGRRLAILGQVESQLGLFVYDLAAGSFTQLLFDPYWWFDGSSVTWSPQGDRLAYRRYSPSGAFETVEVATAEVTVLTTQPQNEQVQFAADGASLVYGATDPSSGQNAIYRFALPAGPAELLTPSFGSLGQLSPDLQQLLYVDFNGVPVLRSLAGGEEVSLEPFVGSGFFDRSLWTPSGYLIVSTSGYQARIEPAGRFEFAPVNLAVGDNSFTAEATDAAGQTGPRSEEMVIRIAAADRPDLVITASDIVLLPAVARTGQTVRIAVTVENRGAQAAPASELSIVVLGPDGFNTVVVNGPALAELAPGGRQTVVRDVVVGTTAGTYTVAAGADPFGRIAEVDELNNRTQVSLPVLAPGQPLLDVTTDRVLYFAGDPVVVTGRVTNGDEAPFSGRVLWSIVDEDGFLVETLPEQPVTALPFGQTVAVTVTWNSDGIFAGDYRVLGRLHDAAGHEVAADAEDFALAADAQVAAQVSTDRGLYELGQRVAIDGAVMVVAGNVTLTDAVAHLSLFDANGDLVQEWSEPLADLLPGGSTSVAVTWPSTGAALGEYVVRLEVEQGDNVVATAETRFGVTAGEVVVAGELVLDDRTPALGQLLGVTYTIENLGAAPLAPLPFTVAIEDPTTGAVLAFESGTTDLDPGAETSGTVSFSTSGLSLGNYPVVLRATVPVVGGGSQVVTLRITSFTTVDEEPPLVTILTPPAGGYLGANLLAQVRAVDALSLVRTAEVSVDGGDWSLLTTGDPTENRYDGVLAGLSEGLHRIRARATDSWSNTGESDEVVFTVDTIPPRITVGVVTAGGQYLPPVAPTVEIVEEHPATQSITLNGVPYVPGTLIPTDGNYVLQVSATDLAGNRAEVTVPFTLFTPPVLTIGDVTVTEGDAGTTTASFPVTLAAPALLDVTVEFTTGGGTATAGADYTATAGSVTIPAGQLSAVAAVPVLGDLLDEADETFEVTLANPTNAILGDALAIGTIVDDDAAPSLSIADVSVTEGNAGTTDAVFTVTLSAATSFAVTFDYTTADGSATAGSDYTASTGSVTIPAGSTSATVTVAVLGDELDEADETFTVTLPNPTNATLGDGSATGTIVDDDAAPSLSIADVSGTEGNAGPTDGVFTVTLSAPTTVAVTF
ncbi:MAG: CARDB domain-containing protein, partial [Thermoanaerobaculia bacterium]|nr:CARDB domain-containing protein [Thermoanaerobaculia bacterium]